MNKEQNLILTRSYKFTDIKAQKRSEGDADDGVKRVEGHAAVFGSKTNICGWFEEIIERGAFDGTDFDDVPLFVNHDWRKIPLARSRRNNGGSTMRLKIDEAGLFVSADIDTKNNSEARQLFSSVERGDISGMSFVFSVKEERWEGLDSELPLRHIIKINKVFDVSAVTTPAYEKTDIHARDKAALDNARLALENARSQELENSRAVELYREKIKLLGGM
ncbi:MAG: HK97 family phage prohead protease [Acidaminococcales bacterium]|jgi:HK97 family phage prohead protease|nr:HK97 family phage prohead protease [Acidaminococcales bacterium]